MCSSFSKLSDGSTEYTHTHTCMHMCTYMHIFTQTHACTLHIHAHRYTHTHTHMHTHTPTHTQSCTHTPPRSALQPSLFIKLSNGLTEGQHGMSGRSEAELTIFVQTLILVIQVQAEAAWVSWNNKVAPTSPCLYLLTKTSDTPPPSLWSHQFFKHGSSDLKVD